MTRSHDLIDEWEQERAAYRQAHVRRMLPPRYRLVDPSTEMHPELAAWRGERSVYVAGLSDSGKTHQLACLAKLSAANDRSVVWFSEIDLIDRLRTAEISDGADATKLVIATSPTIVIDDFGKARSTKFTLEKLFWVVDHAYQHDQRLLVSSEFSLKEIATKLIEEDRGGRVGAAIARRLLEMSGGQTLLTPSWWLRGAA